MPETILIVDDEPDLARLLELTLGGEGYDVHVAFDGEEALKVAFDVRPDLVVLDVMMPGIDGFEVCRRLRSDHRTAHASVIMLTARTTPVDRVTGLTAGADDYVTKPFDPDELLARVHTTLRRNHLLRGTSPLTGLPGNFEIERAIGRLIDEGLPFALLHVDLDRFKAYNDRYGFLRGDGAIRFTAGVLEDASAAATHSPAFLGHIGGDDFAMVLHPDDVEAVTSAVIAAFDEGVGCLYDESDRAQGCIETIDRQGRVTRHPLMTISIGVATTGQREFTSPVEAAAVATEMKQLAKSESRSTWRIDRRRQ